MDDGDCSAASVGRRRSGGGQLAGPAAVEVSDGLDSRPSSGGLLPGCPSRFGRRSSGPARQGQEKFPGLRCSRRDEATREVMDAPGRSPRILLK